MPREKEGYRDMISVLIEKKHLPLFLNKGQACEVLGISRDHLAKLIAEGEIKVTENKISLGSIARCVCG